MATLVEQIEKLLTPSIEDLGFVVVQVKLIDGNKSRLLQIMAEKPDGTMNVDHCAEISNHVSAILDVEDIIPGMYRLEISSPGIDRPLVKRADYEKYLGHLAKIELTLPVAGRKRYTGVLRTLVGDTLTLDVDGKPVALELTDIQAAKLLLTDELIALVTGQQMPGTKKKAKK
ncbi:MAG: ribosome maturation factor RimP [Azospirillum brasilense]|nr:MAG: ribosome maturation factor RimP [Azospirillum brasilense]